jgi:thioredoxin-like negative regulator of GroEL
MIGMPYFNPWRLSAKSRKIPAMPSLHLDSDNRDQLAAALDGQGWVVACLCAAWCGTCSSYRAAFDGLAERHPDKTFVWIDIEDQADVVGDLDVDNFPTLLLQRGDKVAFFGTMLPDPKVTDRLVQAQAALGDEELSLQAVSSEERRGWQRTCNLRILLESAE